MVIIKSREMICQGFTLAVLRHCLLLGLFAFSFIFSEWKSVGMTDSSVLIRFRFVAMRSSWVAFVGCSRSLSICTVKLNPISFAGFESELYMLENPATSINSRIICKHQWPSSTAATHAHVHNVYQTIWYVLDHKFFLFFATRQSESIQRILFQNCDRLFCRKR